MRYIINFQVKILDEQNSLDIIRSSYTILEKESKENNLSDFIKVEDWFKKLFKEKPLDYFINTSKMKKKVSSLEMDIGKITDSLSGEYKNF